MNFRIWAIFSLLFLLSACTTDDFSDVEIPVNDEPSDLIPVPKGSGKADEISSSFNKNSIVTDDFFQDFDAVTGDDIQSFLEDSPYGRSWMANERVDGVRAADLIVQAAREEGINPILLLIRLQVEQTLVSPSSRPPQSRINRALGCGCFDGSSCSSAYLGFGKQMACGAATHRKLFKASVDGGAWSVGKSRRTSDQILVTPSNHATAALYGYTPWVLTNRGGNWLVWNVARKFVEHMIANGHYHSTPSPWIGTPCQVDGDCGFTGSGQQGFCHDFVDVDGASRGFCTIMCDGYCPDRDGRATTFCVEGEPGLGLCAAKAEQINKFCESIPGTVETERTRHIGDSSASASQATVCVP